MSEDRSEALETALKAVLKTLKKRGADFNVLAQEAFAELARAPIGCQLAAEAFYEIEIATDAVLEPAFETV